MGGSLEELSFLGLRNGDHDSRPFFWNRLDGQVPSKILDMGSHIRESKAIVSDLGWPEPNPVIPDFQPGCSFS